MRISRNSKDMTELFADDNSMDVVINKQRELKRNLADLSGKLDSLHDEFAELKTSLQQNKPRRTKKIPFL